MVNGHITLFTNLYTSGWVLAVKEWPTVYVFKHKCLTRKQAFCKFTCALLLLHLAILYGTYPRMGAKGYRNYLAGGLSKQLHNCGSVALVPSVQFSSVPLVQFSCSSMFSCASMFSCSSTFSCFSTYIYTKVILKKTLILNFSWTMIVALR